ncbi:MAG: hypothetical protein LBR26_13130 [Prevotella sp.]|jgi:hypothetical protein|nr:hypothetical protein [Prevotella sp.]
MKKIKEPEAGTCKICGCTDENACMDSWYGPCWWTDETQTLCSHCASPENPRSLAALRLRYKKSVDE